MKNNHLKTVAIAGASGYIGQHVLPQLAKTYHLIGLGRRRQSASSHIKQWRQVDLLHYTQVEHALRDCDALLYLVHSMAPHPTVHQANFSDTDLLCADNVGRAAQSCGLKHIVYLGGLIPPEQPLSYHLKSRLEVESALASYQVPVTTLRAGLIVGPHGSSTELLLRLVQALPMMIVPAWGQIQTQPISLTETVGLLEYALDHPELAGKAYDIGGEEIVTIVDLLKQTATIMDKKRWILPVPVRTFRLSLLWVSVITRLPTELVLPLLASLNHEMIVRDGHLLQHLAQKPKQSLKEALRQAYLTRQSYQEPLRILHFFRGCKKILLKPFQFLWQPARTITFLHRFPWRAEWSAQVAAEDYLQALPKIVWPWIRVTYPNSISFRFYFGPWPLLAFQKRTRQSSPTKEVYVITGGLLAARQTIRMGRLEFRLVLQGQQLMIVIMDYLPRLPWWLYRCSQHIAHRVVMRCFAYMVQKKVSH